MLGFGAIGEFALAQVSNPQGWDAVDEQGETWTAVTAQAETWTQVTPQAETWTEA